MTSITTTSSVGKVDASMCTGEWQNGITTFTVGITANFIIKQADQKGNAVFTIPESTPFEIIAQNVANGLKGSIININFKPLGNGSQDMLLLSFTMHEAGNYVLQVKTTKGDVPGSFGFSFYPGANMVPPPITQNIQFIYSSDLLLPLNKVISKKYVLHRTNLYCELHRRMVQ